VYRLLTRPRRPVRRRDERGAVAIIVAVSMTALLVVAAMVLDFGLVRVDRQVDKSAADSATLAGLHALNTGDGTPHPYIGVCTAVRYLKTNSERFSTIDESSGWTNGMGTSTSSGCSDTALRNRVCKPADKASWARFRWSGTWQSAPFEVTVESGYDLAANKWAEDTLPASSGDTGAVEQAGCDHLAVTITQSRKPGLGVLATSSDLTTSIRSVGRVKTQPGDSAPAMHLLKRAGCPVLVTGSSGGQSFIRVLGAVATDGSGKTQPGTIHADSNGQGCTGGNNSWVFGGLAPHGIVAYAAPMASNPSSADPAKPGSISSVAAAEGLNAAVVRDSLNYVYGSSALNGTTGAKSESTGRSLVTRRLVDERYFPGVKTAVSSATSVFASGASGAPADWTSLSAADPCKPTQQEVNALNLSATSKLYVNCSTNAGFAGPGGPLTIPAGAIYFRGVVSPSSTLKLPNAHHVYVGNHTDRADAISVSNNTSFEINNASGNINPTTGNCNTGQLPSKSVLVVRAGAFKQTGGLLRMCRTTVLMMGGSHEGCVPASTGSAPTLTPCSGGVGSGQFSQNGGGIDWTAPDRLDATIDDDGEPLPAALAAWEDPDGPEDLALWSESAGGYNMAGGGLFAVRGVFMVPNADPFTISGGANLTLTNAQYITSSIRLNGNTTAITMSVDPNSAVTLPELGVVGLVR
jgi:Flp pilus assembly protein TadG